MNSHHRRSFAEGQIIDTVQITTENISLWNEQLRLFGMISRSFEMVQ